MTTSSSTISAKFGCMMLRILIAASIMATASCGLESTSFTGVQQVPEILTVTGETMGTTFKVLMVVDKDVLYRRGLTEAIDRRLKQISGLMSHYDPHSELSGFNSSLMTVPYQISPEVLDVVEAANEVSRISAGAFDITVGPLVDAWGFGPAGQPSNSPSQETLKLLSTQVGYQHLEVDRVNSTLRKRVPELVVDLSGIAKGYAVDALALLLEEQSINDYVVEIGGELRVSGLNEHGNSWRVAIERPAVGVLGVQRVVALSTGAMATSGDYRNFFDLENNRVSHMIDPRTGHPASQRLFSVTVFADSCMLADARATALAVLGQDDGYELARREGWAVLFTHIDSAGEAGELSTPALQEWFGDAMSEKL